MTEIEGTNIQTLLLKAKSDLWNTVLPHNSKTEAYWSIDSTGDLESYIVVKAKTTEKGELEKTLFGRTQYTYDIVSFVPYNNRTPRVLVEKDVDLGLGSSYRSADTLVHVAAAKLNRRNTKLDRQAKRAL